MGFLLLVVGLGLVIVLLGVGLLWQERADLPELQTIYGVEDSIEFVWEGLGEGSRSRLRRSDVRRMLEWSIAWVQSAEARGGAPAVVGGLDAATYVQDRCWEQGHPYEPQDVLAVLDLQARYLAALGVVGEPADPRELEDER